MQMFLVRAQAAERDLSLQTTGIAKSAVLEKWRRHCPYYRSRIDRHSRVVYFWLSRNGLSRRSYARGHSDTLVFIQGKVALVGQCIYGRHHGASDVYDRTFDSSSEHVKNFIGPGWSMHGGVFSSGLLDPVTERSIRSQDTHAETKPPLGEA